MTAGGPFTEVMGCSGDQGDLGTLPGPQAQTPLPASGSPRWQPASQGTPDFQVHPRMVSSKLCEQENTVNIFFIKRKLMDLPPPTHTHHHSASIIRNILEKPFDWENIE